MGEWRELESPTRQGYRIRRQVRQLMGLILRAKRVLKNAVMYWGNDVIM